MNDAPFWAGRSSAKKTSLDVELDLTTGVATIIVTFDTALTYRAAANLLTGVDDIDTECNCVVENNINQLKMVYNNDTITTVVPYLAN